jgi:hypothetical protein
MINEIKQALEEFTSKADARSAKVEGSVETVAKEVVTLKGSVDDLVKKHGTTEKWIKEVEAKVENARSKDPGGDALKNAIPDDYRIYIEREERRGVKDPVEKVAQSLWFHSLHMAKVASLALKDTQHTAPEYRS